MSHYTISSCRSSQKCAQLNTNCDYWVNAQRIDENVQINNNTIVDAQTQRVILMEANRFEQIFYGKRAIV